MGIQFEEMDFDSRINMLQIMSASGDIPIDTFLIEGYIETGEELNREPDMRMLDLSTRKSNEIIPQDKPDMVSNENTFPGKKKYYNHMLKYLLIAVVLSTGLAYIILYMKEDMNKHNKDQLLIPSKSATYRNSGEHISPSSHHNNQSARALDPIIPLSAKPDMLKEEGLIIPDKIKLSSSDQSPPAKISPENNEYYTQVGAWINPEYAKRTLTQLNKYYPDATIVVQNNFNKIKIPGIKNRTEGNKVIKDIEDKFHLHPLLVLNQL